MNLSEDGVRHINIYSAGKTKLGRDLSNFSLFPFMHPLHGRFNSVEGYWYWLTRCDERLRDAYGIDAKKMGRGLPRVFSYKEDLFKSFVRSALTAKIQQNKEILNALIKSDLPFVHYYVMGPEKKIVFPENSDWIIDHIADIRCSFNPGKIYHSVDISSEIKRSDFSEDVQMGLF